LPGEPTPFKIGGENSIGARMQNVVMMAKPTASMTWEDCREFVERTRRQLARFDALPHRPGQTFPPEYAAEINRLCDELEQDIKNHLG
jgi:hypothetical protein